MKIIQVSKVNISKGYFDTQKQIRTYMVKGKVKYTEETLPHSKTTTVFKPPDSSMYSIVLCDKFRVTKRKGHYFAGICSSITTWKELPSEKEIMKEIL